MAGLQIESVQEPEAAPPLTIESVEEPGAAKTAAPLAIESVQEPGAASNSGVPLSRWDKNRQLDTIALPINTAMDAWKNITEKTPYDPNAGFMERVGSGVKDTLKVGKGLLEIASLPFTPLTGAIHDTAGAALGTIWPAGPGKFGGTAGHTSANEALDTALMAIAPGKGGVRPPTIKAPSVAAEAPTSPSFNAYHGSSENFNTFNSDKINTGQGAQSYGYGLYVAENPKTAQTYSRVKTGGGTSSAGMRLSDLEKGPQYQVRVNADKNDFIDWDKPLKEQSQLVQKAIAQFSKNGGPIGGQFIKDTPTAPAMPLGMWPELRRAETASALKDLGVPGIKYLDQGSRLTGEGTRNYVVFDANNLDITHKNGQPIPAPEAPSSPQVDAASTPPARAADQITPGPDVSGGRAQTLIREHEGEAARRIAQAQNQLDPFQRGETYNKIAKHLGAQPEEANVNLMDDKARYDFLHYMETRSQPDAAPIDPKYQKVADTVRDVFQNTRKDLEATPSLDKMNFYDDYVSHYFANPKEASDFAANWKGASKQGSGGKLKARSDELPTIKDALDAGLKLKTNNPLEIANMYTLDTQHFLATNRIVDAARVAGDVKYFLPGSKKIPEGWQPLNGRLGTKQTPAGLMKAYAPPEWAHTYNTFYSKGFADISPKYGRIADVAQHAVNQVTSLELGLSLYHFRTMAREAFSSSMAKGVGELASGEFKRGAKSVLTQPVKPATLYMKGKQFTDVYLNPNKPGADPAMKEVVDLLTKTNWRALGINHASDYKYTSAGTYFDAFKKGTLKAELAMGFKNSPVKTAIQQIGRTMQTVAQPLFQEYIPHLKNGAAYETMRSWLDLNPAATAEQKIKAATKIADSMDNRFGELMQDNLFWNKALRQTLQMALRASGWDIGEVREIGGGIKDTLKNPKSMSMKNASWSPRANYNIAMAATYPLLSMVYQYLKTGEGPKDVKDVLNPRTGGAVPGFAGRSTVPERAVFPGYEKDVFGFMHDPREESANKLSTLPRKGWEVLHNRDFKNDMIVNPAGSPPDWAKQYAQYIYQSFGPMSIRQMIKGEKVGSGISSTNPVDLIFGPRPAPVWAQDPEGYRRGMQGIDAKAWQKKEMHDRRQNKQYGIQE